MDKTSITQDKKEEEKNQIQNNLNSNRIWTATQNLTIPKIRFDEINFKLKKCKAELSEITQENEKRKKLTRKLVKALIISKAETLFVLQGINNLSKAKSMLDFSKLKLERNGSVSGLAEEVLRIKESQNNSFEK
jgi:hypothetical protein